MLRGFFGYLLVGDPSPAIFVMRVHYPADSLGLLHSWHLVAHLQALLFITSCFSQKPLGQDPKQLQAVAHTCGLYLGPRWQELLTHHQRECITSKTQPCPQLPQDGPANLSSVGFFVDICYKYIRFTVQALQISPLKPSLLPWERRITLMSEVSKRGVKLGWNVKL